MLLLFAKYGRKELVLFSLFWIACGIAVSLFLHPAAATVPALGLMFNISFFRDPERRIPDGEGLLVSPADGTVTEISEVEEAEFLKTPCHKIGIFLSIFNVHVNRSPCEGEVKAVKYTPGKFLDARNLESSKVNEKNAVQVGDVLVIQISGAIARRIVCEAKPGDRLARGERFGMIKYGSRTELFIPKDRCREIAVKLGDKVKGGKSILIKTA